MHPLTGCVTNKKMWKSTLAKECINSEINLISAGDGLCDFYFQHTIIEGRTMALVISPVCALGVIKTRGHSLLARLRQRGASEQSSCVGLFGCPILLYLFDYLQHKAPFNPDWEQMFPYVALSARAPAAAERMRPKDERLRQCRPYRNY